MLPGACAVLTYMFDCMSYFSMHSANTRVPRVVFWDIDNSQMQVDSTCMHSTNTCVPCCWEEWINMQMLVVST